MRAFSRDPTWTGSAAQHRRRRCAESRCETEGTGEPTRAPRRRSTRCSPSRDSARSPSLKHCASISATGTRCKLHKLGRKQIVFGVGNPKADLMFVGEAPGADEDKQGDAVRRPRGAAADEDHRGDRSAARRRLHRQRDQVPAAGEPQSGAGRSRARASRSCSGRSTRSSRR